MRQMGRSVVEGAATGAAAPPQEAPGNSPDPVDFPSRASRASMARGAAPGKKFGHDDRAAQRTRGWERVCCVNLEFEGPTPQA